MQLFHAPFELAPPPLVGAGPGDPGLITVKGLQRLHEAHVVVYDRLVHPDLLKAVPDAAHQVYVGKSSGYAAATQAEIEDLLVAYGRAGKRVVRLKGGDPFVFGRGGEEAAALRAAGVAFEVVPGISSAVAAPAAAGIPVTDRRAGSSVAVVTGHRHPRDLKNDVNWRGLARSVDTLVILMGTRHVASIADQLMLGGLSAHTPAAAVQWGTHQGQVTLVTTLDELAGRMRDAGIGSPAVIVVGEVVGLRETILGSVQSDVPPEALAALVSLSA
ncbi:MAG: uroporphyrinogen-III C-methyltransferase [Actinomycetota bacterium]